MNLRFFAPVKEKEGLCQNMYKVWPECADEARGQVHIYRVCSVLSVKTGYALLFIIFLRSTTA